MTKHSPAPTPRLPVSWGELVDKITILEIKSKKLAREGALVNVKKELSALISAYGAVAADAALVRLKDRLRSVNEMLWEIEDRIRDKERHKQFDSEFVELARCVYRRNDERARIKKEINELLSSEFIEEKSYQSY